MPRRRPHRHPTSLRRARACARLVAINAAGPRPLPAAVSHRFAPLHHLLLCSMSSHQRTPLTPGKAPPPYQSTSSSSSSSSSSPKPPASHSTSPSMRDQTHTRPYAHVCATPAAAEPARVSSGGSASIFISCSNMLNTLIGAGICAMPYSFAAAGIVPGFFLVVICGLTSALGVYLLTRCAARLGGTQTSFFAIASAVWPSARQAIDAAIAIKCFGVAISYLIIAGQLMPQVSWSLARILTGSPDGLPPILYSREFWIAAWAIVLAPLCFLRRLDSLRHTSYVSFLAVLYLVVIVVWYFFIPPTFYPETLAAASNALERRTSLQVLADPPHKGEIHWFRMTSEFLSVSPIFVFAFTCAHNMLAVYNELEDHTEKRTNTVITWSIGLAGVLYELVAILGYLTFGSSVSANVIASYPADSLFVCGGRLAIVALTLMSYPLTIHPCRASLANIYTAFYPSRAEVSTEEREALVATEAAQQAPVPVPEELGVATWSAVTVVLVSTTTAIALAVEDLSLALGFVGSVGSTSISFILPGLLYWRMFRNADPVDEAPDGRFLPLEEGEGSARIAHAPAHDEDLAKPRAARKHTLHSAIGLTIWGVVVLVVTLAANIRKVLK